MTSAFAIASIPDVDLVPRAEEPMRPLEKRTPRSRVAGAWRFAGGVWVRKCGLRVVAQVIVPSLREPPTDRFRWIVEGEAGHTAGLIIATRACDARLRRRGWRLAP